MKLLVNTVAAAILMIFVASMAHIMQAKTVIATRDGEPQYSNLVPESFGEWKLVPSVRLVLPVESGALSNLIYSQMVGRGYVNKSGDLVMLMIAYGPRQIDRLQLHRPEICYVAEGFRVAESSPAVIGTGVADGKLAVRKLVARREGRTERMTFWMRIGDDVVSTQLGQQLEKLHYGLQGVIPDGALIRVSTVNMDEAQAKAVQEKFIRDMFGAVGNANLKPLIGHYGAALQTDGLRSELRVGDKTLAGG